MPLAEVSTVPLDVFVTLIPLADVLPAVVPAELPELAAALEPPVEGLVAAPLPDVPLLPQAASSARPAAAAGAAHHRFRISISPFGQVLSTAPTSSFTYPEHRSFTAAQSGPSPD
jgi:hypothetical protein